MKYRSKPQTVEAVQVTRDIDRIAPDWFVQEMNKGNIVIGRCIGDGFTSVYGCTVYFCGNKYKARIGDYIVKDSTGICTVKRSDFKKFYEEVKEEEE